MTMDWTYPSGAGPEGLFEIGRRLSAQQGRIPDATSFINDAREMLRITRRVEAVARGGRLLVGFQNAAKLDAEVERYRGLIADGTSVIAFGSGRPAEEIPGLEYREQSPHPLRLANQWFLVSEAPEPVGFASWEISDPALFGTGGAATEGKQFVGFISDDRDVVSELHRYLVGVPGLEAPPPPPAERLADDRQVQRLADSARDLAPEATGAPAGAAIVPLRRGDDDTAVRLALAIARNEQRDLVIVDRSGEGILGSPYTDLRGDDAFRPRPERTFDAAVALREGRSNTARAIAAASLLGVTAGGWFPTSSGANGIEGAIDRFNGRVIVVPGSIGQPSVGERIRGMTLPNLQRLGYPVVVAD